MASVCSIDMAGRDDMSYTGEVAVIHYLEMLGENLSSDDDVSVPEHTSAYEVFEKKIPGFIHLPLSEESVRYLEVNPGACGDSYVWRHLNNWLDDQGGDYEYQPHLLKIPWFSPFGLPKDDGIYPWDANNSEPYDLDDERLSSRGPRPAVRFILWDDEEHLPKVQQHIPLNKYKDLINARLHIGPVKICDFDDDEESLRSGVEAPECPQEGDELQLKDWLAEAFFYDVYQYEELVEMDLLDSDDKMKPVLIPMSKEIVDHIYKALWDQGGLSMLRVFMPDRVTELMSEILQDPGVADAIIKETKAKTWKVQYDPGWHEEWNQFDPFNKKETVVKKKHDDLDEDDNRPTRDTMRDWEWCGF
ncbi:hypothetical protein EJ06DRAFT_580930 [Trichodelitschia bisporula]|uniref:Uncharacterized protein n=1 Tax=Trichodelitschia bisporula TaxID=703511 RepID=A0A6G1I034_9PEZI|nr:hypothetical protein EJ06DRAFT_580930 [Trichodelitschia bisporula]